jgi:hypothetical protein
MRANTSFTFFSMLRCSAQSAVVQRGACRCLRSVQRHGLARADYEQPLPSTTPLVEPQTATVGAKHFGQRVAFPLAAVQVQK